MNSKSDRRRTSRQPVNHVAQIQLGSGMLPRDCLINDISGGGVRLHVEGFDVPDDFVLLLSGPGIAKECAYRVVWRLENEIGASFVSFVRRPSAAIRG